MEASGHNKYILTYGVRVINLLSLPTHEEHRLVALINTNAIDTLVNLLEEHGDDKKSCLEASVTVALIDVMADIAGQ